MEPLVAILVAVVAVAPLIFVVGLGTAFLVKQHHERQQRRLDIEREDQELADAVEAAKAGEETLG